MTTRRPKADRDSALLKAALQDAWNAGLELEFYRELADSVRVAEGMLLDGDSGLALAELVVALERLDHWMTTLG